MKPTANRNRKIRISVRLNEAEHCELLKKCSETGLSIEGLIRQLIDGMQIRQRPTEEYLRLRKEIAAIGNNINQIARIANSCKGITREQICRIQELMIRIWELFEERM